MTVTVQCANQIAIASIPTTTHHCALRDRHNWPGDSIAAGAGDNFATIIIATPPTGTVCLIRQNPHNFLTPPSFHPFEDMVI